MRHAIFLLGMAMAAAVRAGVTVSDVTASQNWPWDTRVTVSFTIADDEAGGVYDVTALKVAKDGLSRPVALDAFPAAVSGDLLSLPAGRHTLVWDPAKMSPFGEEAVALSDVTFEVSVAPAPNGARNYLVIDLSGGPTAASYPVTTLDAPPAGGWTLEHKTTKLVLRRVKAGAYTAGSPADRPERSGYETQGAVTLTNDFWIGVFETTQRQWELVTGLTASNGSNYATEPAGAYPVYCVSYADVRGVGASNNWPKHAGVDADSFMGLLTAKFARPACVPADRIFDLPTVAQWQYACRAGTATDWNNDRNLDYTTAADGEQYDANLARLGWFRNNAGYKIHEVGLKLPNAWGLYDMHGNAAEWGRDHVMGSPSGVEPIGGNNGSDGKSGCSYRAQMGGSYNGGREGSLSTKSIGLYTSSYVGRSASTDQPTSRDREWLGFRVALVYEKGSAD